MDTKFKQNNVCCISRFFRISFRIWISYVFRISFRLSRIFRIFFVYFSYSSRCFVCFFVCISYNFRINFTIFTGMHCYYPSFSIQKQQGRPRLVPFDQWHGSRHVWTLWVAVHCQTSTIPIGTSRYPWYSANFLFCDWNTKARPSRWDAAHWR